MLPTRESRALLTCGTCAAAAVQVEVLAQLAHGKGLPDRRRHCASRGSLCALQTAQQVQRETAGCPTSFGRGGQGVRTRNSPGLASPAPQRSTCSVAPKLVARSSTAAALKRPLCRAGRLLAALLWRRCTPLPLPAKLSRASSSVHNCLPTAAVSSCPVVRSSYTALKLSAPCILSYPCMWASKLPSWLACTWKICTVKQDLTRRRCADCAYVSSVSMWPLV